MDPSEDDYLDGSQHSSVSHWNSHGSPSQSFGTIDPRLVQTLRSMIEDPTQLGYYLGSSMGLNDEHQGDIALLSHFVCDSSSMLTVYNIAAQFRTQEVLEGFKDIHQGMDQVFEDYRVSKAAERKAVKTLTDPEKNSITRACKEIICQVSRIVFKNDALVKDIYAHLKDNHKSNAFTAHFKNKEPEASAKIIRSAIRREASQVKSNLRNAYIDTKTEGASTAASVITGRMTGSEPGLPQMLRVLLIRRFIRLRPDLFMSPREKESSKRKMKGTAQNVVPAPNSSQPASSDAAPVMKGSDAEGSTWQAFQDWLEEQIKERGMFSSDNQEWKRFYGDCVREETALFPNDTLAKIPRNEVDTSGSGLGSFVGLASSLLGSTSDANDLPGPSRSSSVTPAHLPSAQLSPLGNGNNAFSFGSPWSQTSYGTQNARPQAFQFTDVFQSPASSRNADPRSSHQERSQPRGMSSLLN